MKNFELLKCIYLFIYTRHTKIAKRKVLLRKLFHVVVHHVLNAVQKIPPTVNPSPGESPPPPHQRVRLGDGQHF